MQRGMMYSTSHTSNVQLTAGTGTPYDQLKTDLRKPLEKHLDILIHYIHNLDGTYFLNPELKNAHSSTMKQSVLHKSTERTISGIEEQIEALYSAKFFFLTDYENYFIVALCGPAGLVSIVKNRRAYPTAMDVMNIWNALSEQGEIPKLQIEFKHICVSRHYTTKGL
ncbi:uncharacterized protein LOC144423039 isoform X2 [Styela clava]